MGPKLKPHELVIQGLKATRKKLAERIKKLEEIPTDIKDLKRERDDIDAQIKEKESRTT